MENRIDVDHQSEINIKLYLVGDVRSRDIEGDQSQSIPSSNDVAQLFDSVEQLYTFSREQPNKYEREFQNCIAAPSSWKDPATNFLFALINCDTVSGKAKPNVRLAVLLLREMVTKQPWREFISTTVNLSPDLGNGLLHEAARCGFTGMLSGFIDQGNVNLRDQHNRTALHYAAYSGKFEDCGILLSKGASMDADSNGRTPLHLALMSTEPSFDVVQLLVGSLKVRHPNNYNGVLSRQTDEDGNTALHIAAGNINTSPAIILELTGMNPIAVNNERQTAFHIAAESANSSLIIWMLDAFAPSKNGWDIDDADDATAFINKADKHLSTGVENAVNLNGQDEVITSGISSTCSRNSDDKNYGDTNTDRAKDDDVSLEDGRRLNLLDICVTTGNSQAVASLILHGADISRGVLHTLVDESARNPDKAHSYLAIYQAIVDNAVVWRCLEENMKIPLKGSKMYYSYLKETMRFLISLPKPADENGPDVLERAIESGSQEMLVAIMNTEHVCREFRRGTCFHVRCTRAQLHHESHVRFDVTGFVWRERCSCRCAAGEPDDDVAPRTSRNALHGDDQPRG